MDRADAGIEAAEVDTAEEPEHGSAAASAAVLRRVWSIGKGVAITGAAITSAPIVIPPLVVLSALVLALSLPYGIYLAGYACTVKLMGALLPLPGEDGEEAAQPEDAAERGFDALGEYEKAWEGEKQERGEISKVPSSRSEEEEEEEEKLREKVEGKEIEKMAKAVAADEDRNRHYSLQEDMRGAEQLEEDIEDASAASSENTESLIKSPYTVVLMAPKAERENEPPSFSQEHLSIAEATKEKKKLSPAFAEMQPKEAVELRGEDEDGDEEERPTMAKGSLKTVERASSAVDFCPKKEEEEEEEEEEDEKLDRSWEKAVAADEDRNRHYSQQEVTRGAEQVGEDLENAPAAASENDEERDGEKEPSPKSPYTVALMVPNREKDEKDEKDNEPPNLIQEHLSIAEVRREEEELNPAFAEMQPKEAVRVRGEDEDDDGDEVEKPGIAKSNSKTIECSSSTVDVSPKKEEEDEQLDRSWVHGRKKKCSSRWACWKSHY